MWSGLGLNFGFQNSNGSESYTGTLAGDMDYLKTVGVTKLRFVGNTNDATMAFMRTQAPIAKAKGFYVVFGCSANGVTLTSSNFADYQTQVLAEAVVAEANGLDEFVIGNEEELRIDGSTIGDTRGLILSHLKPLATAVRAVYSGLISYNMSNGAEAWILTKDANDILPGPSGALYWDLDKIGLNPYGDTDKNGSIASFQDAVHNVINDSHWGSRFYISEWNEYNHSATYFSTTTNWDKITGEVANRLKILQDEGVTSAYYFTWIYSGGNRPYAVYRSDGNIATWWNNLTTNNGRRWFI